MPEKQNPLKSSNNNKDRSRAQTYEQEEITIFTSDTRNSFYKCFRILWFGCCEPTHYVTTKYAKETKKKACGCGEVTQSMAMENITDVRREQTCCCVILNGLPCFCCFNDMGNIVLYGTDDSERLSSGDPKRWIITRVPQSLYVLEKMTGHLQLIHKDWRLTGRKLERKIQQLN